MLALYFLIGWIVCVAYKRLLAILFCFFRMILSIRDYTHLKLPGDKCYLIPKDNRLVKEELTTVYVHSNEKPPPYAAKGVWSMLGLLCQYESVFGRYGIGAYYFLLLLLNPRNLVNYFVLIPS